MNSVWGELTSLILGNTKEKTSTKNRDDDGEEKKRENSPKRLGSSVEEGIDELLDLKTGQTKGEATPVNVENFEKAISFKKENKLIFRFDADFDPDDVETPTLKNS